MLIRAECIYDRGPRCDGVACSVRTYVVRTLTRKTNRRRADAHMGLVSHERHVEFRVIQFLVRCTGIAHRENFYPYFAVASRIPEKNCDKSCATESDDKTIISANSYKISMHVSLVSIVGYILMALNGR